MSVMIILMIVLVLAAFWATMTSLMLRAAIALALTSVVLTMIMFQLGAPLAAVFELSVCAGLIPVIFISVISMAHRLPYKEYLRRRQDRRNRFWPLPIILIVVAAVMYWFRPPLDLLLPYPQAVADVRDILWDHRRLDLFGQILALLAGAFGVVVLFKKERDR